MDRLGRQGCSSLQVHEVLDMPVIVDEDIRLSEIGEEEDKRTVAIVAREEMREKGAVIVFVDGIRGVGEDLLILVGMRLFSSWWRRKVRGRLSR